MSEKYLPNLGRAQNILRACLDELASILDEKSVTYWLDFGSLLGSIRHKDFIPWDDDIDLAVLRSDLPKVIIFVEEIFQSSLKVSQPNPDEVILMPLKLQLLQVRSTETEMLVRGIPEHLHPGIGIDIFPIDPRVSLPGTLERMYRSFISQLWRTKQLVHHRSSTHNSDRNVRRSIWYGFVKLTPRRLIEIAIDRDIAKNCSLGQANYFLHGIDTISRKQMHPKDTIFPLKRAYFGNQSFSVPAKYAEYLASLYGEDFMEIPIPSDRVTHASKISLENDFGE